MSLFSENKPPKPLAEKLRPTAMDEVLGQDEAKRMLSGFVDQGEMPSIVLWGPPGSGKTTLSRLMANLLGWEGRSLNATSASVKDIRDLAAEARQTWVQMERRTLLFIDEIHRLNKAQQDVLLPIVEAGTVILAGSTTENPFFSLNQALRSRVQLIRLSPLEPEIIKAGLERAGKSMEVTLDNEAVDWVAERVSGDLRLAYTVLESATYMARGQGRGVTLADVSLCLTQTQLAGDRKGDNHYDLASAYQKSLRGSDANAAVYYLARFLEMGEDPRFIARRLLVTAAEDVGNADPNAFLIASNAFRAVEVLGMPECRIPLSQATIYVAEAPKSNESVTAIGKATAYIQNHALEPIPTHLRDAHYKGAASLGHGVDYIYTHNNPKQSQKFLPAKAEMEHFVKPAGGRPEPAKVENEALDWLTDTLRERFGDQSFELDAEALAAEIKWPEARLRKALNQLVQRKKLAFKRVFHLT
ncbi:MAG: replication-associated recombination protein A [Acidobacteriota bacterium]|nr:replication-associated recombination protein A [Acidobacteriota bacterium]